MTVKQALADQRLSPSLKEDLSKHPDDHWLFLTPDNGLVVYDPASNPDLRWDGLGFYSALHNVTKLTPPS